MSEKVSRFRDAAPLDGTEIVPVIQYGSNRKTTVQEIIDTATGVGATIDDSTPSLTKVYSSQKTTDLINANAYFQGIYTTEAALNTAHPSGSAGQWALVDAGVGSKSYVYVWDNDDNVWQQASSDGNVISVNSQTGAVTLTTDDISDEGATNQYFTSARVLAVAATGLSTATNSTVLNTDTLIVAIGKLQAQINAIVSGGSGPTIDDTAPSLTKVYSSQKTVNITGTLTSLTTTDKTNLVAAINEAIAKVVTQNQKINSLATNVTQTII